jgi:hypothetical protein
VLLAQQGGLVLQRQQPRWRQHPGGAFEQAPQISKVAASNASGASCSTP